MDEKMGYNERIGKDKRKEKRRSGLNAHTYINITTL